VNRRAVPWRPLNVTHQLGADFLAETPDHSVRAIPSGTVTGYEQHEFVGHFAPIEIESHATVGNVDNEAVVWRRADPELDLRQSLEWVALRAASLVGFQCVHLFAALDLGRAAATGDSPSR
jgi:hypothetical protein